MDIYLGGLFLTAGLTEQNSLDVEKLPWVNFLNSGQNL